MLTRPWAAWRDLQAINARTREKGVVAQSGGEGAALGGICVIGACPRPRTADLKSESGCRGAKLTVLCCVSAGPQDRTEPSYVYREEIGQPIPASEVEDAIRRVLGA